MYGAIREATRTAALRQRIRIVHLSLQRTHVHLIVEATNRIALARGMQGFQVSAARYINRALQRRGRVFVDRYYVEVIATPTQALRALTYVLCNFRHHGEDRRAEARQWLVDPFSSGASFSGWGELARDARAASPLGFEPLVVSSPQTWLLAEGWKRAGSISAWTVPGKNSCRARMRRAG